jgi:hypothetical protein
MPIPTLSIAEVKLFKTADFAWSKSGNRKTVLGAARRFLSELLFPIARGSPNRETMTLKTKLGTSGASWTSNAEISRLNATTQMQQFRTFRESTRSSSELRLVGWR